VVGQGKEIVRRKICPSKSFEVDPAPISHETLPWLRLHTEMMNIDHLNVLREKVVLG